MIVGAIMTTIFKILKIFKSFDIRKKLLFYSLLITLISVPVLYFFSQHIVYSLIIRENVDYEYRYLHISASYIETFFETIEGNIRQIYNNEAIRKSLTNSRITNDFSNISITTNIITRELDSILFQQNYIDSVILLGINDFAYYYNWGSSGHYLGNNFNFSEFNDKGDILNNKEEGLPFYFQEKTLVSDKNKTEGKIYNLLNNRLVYLRKIRDQENTIKGAIIVSFYPNFISSLTASDPQKNLVLYDYKHELIWSNSNNHDKIALNNIGYKISSINNEQQLVVQEKLNPYGFNLIAYTPIKNILKELYNIKKYSITYSIICVLLVTISSYIFSKKIAEPFHKLTDKFSEKLSLPNINYQDENINSSFYNRLSIKSKIIIYFFITIIIPNLIFISILFSTYFNIYRDEVKKLSTNNIKMVKENLDYNLQKIDEFTKRIAYSSQVQSFVNKNNEDNIPIDKFFSYIKMDKPDLLALSLYNTQGDNLYSSIYFNTFPVERVNKNFFAEMENSKGQLQFLKTNNNYYTDSLITFSRTIRSIQNHNFQEIIAYAVFYLKKDFFNLYSFSNLEDKSYFLISTQNGHIINRNDNGLLFKSDGNILSLLKSEDTSLSYQGNKYLVSQETTDSHNFKLIGLVPYNQINNKLIPLSKINILFITSCFIILLGISSLISLSITRRLNTLENAMKRITKNNDLSIQVANQGNDEIAILTKQFNSMIKRINELIKENYQVKLHESKLMFLEKEAQLNALQQQINPHFLYNTLESIKWMAYTKGALEICDMTTALGNFFRGTISKDNKFITVKEELQHLNNYIYIQNLRYQDKFRVIIDVKEEVKKCKIPKLILQPIVENAIEHGLGELEEGGIISISGFIRNNVMHFTIKDNGIGIKAENLKKIRDNLQSDETENTPNSGIGVKNVYKRLKLYFDSKGNLEIKSKEKKGTIVKFSMPVIFQEK